MYTLSFGIETNSLKNKHWYTLSQSFHYSEFDEANIQNVLKSRLFKGSYQYNVMHIHNYL